MGGEPQLAFVFVPRMDGLVDTSADTFKSPEVERLLLRLREDYKRLVQAMQQSANDPRSRDQAALLQHSLNHALDDLALLLARQGRLEASGEKG